MAEPSKQKPKECTHRVSESYVEKNTRRRVSHGLVRTWIGCPSCNLIILKTFDPEDFDE